MCMIAAVVVGIILVSGIVIWLFTRSKTHSNSTGAEEARAAKELEKKEREKKEHEKKECEKKNKLKFEMATKSSQQLLRELDVGMTQDRVLKEIGMRHRKVFFKLLSSDNHQPYLLSLAEVPGSHGHSNTSFRDHIINHFSLWKRLSHRYLNPILSLCLCSKKGEVLAGGVVTNNVRGRPPLPNKTEGLELPPVTELQVAIIERFHEEGSLRDYMHRVSPTKTRVKKYSSTANPLPIAEVVVFGRQILEAVLYLNDQLPKSMLPLSHIRMENIYLEKDECKLGGYENDILGYTTNLQQVVMKAGYASSVDVIMFGHVMYCMCTGGGIKVDGERVALPGKKHLEAVDDEFKSILQYIFEMKNNKIKHSMKKIYNHKFFTSQVPPPATPSVAMQQNQQQPYRRHPTSRD